jgi:hypothetical protein
MIILKYYNEKLAIAMNDWKTVYQFPGGEQLTPEVHQGKLYYRNRGSSKRISYAQIKKGLIRKRNMIEEHTPF